MCLALYRSHTQSRSLHPSVQAEGTELVRAREPSPWQRSMELHVSAQKGILSRSIGPSKQVATPSGGKEHRPSLQVLWGCPVRVWKGDAKMLLAHLPVQTHTHTPDSRTELTPSKAWVPDSEDLGQPVLPAAGSREPILPGHSAWPLLSTHFPRSHWRHQRDLLSHRQAHSVPAVWLGPETSPRG